MSSNKLPGTLWKSHGAWHWRVTLPGESARKDVILRMPHSGARIPDSASIDLAESAAWRLWEERSKQAGTIGAPVFTVLDLCARWSKYAAEYYADGSREAIDSVAGMRLFRDMFGRRPIEGMTHPDMIAYRNALVEKGYVRTTVNKYVNFVKRMAAWALDERLISARTKAELTAISPVKRSRTAARETVPICAVPDADVEKTCAELVPSLADMVRVHRLTGMRPNEACQLSWQRIEKRKQVWVFRPERHKNRFRNIPRVVVIGPKAQRILEKYPDDGRSYIFSPQLAVQEQYERVAAAAKCHRKPENTKGCPRKACERWKVAAYGKALKPGYTRADVPAWTPNQLRHTCATEIRRSFGMAAAGAVLGHTDGLRITDRYSFEAAEDELIRAATPAMLKMG